MALELSKLTAVQKDGCSSIARQYKDAANPIVFKTNKKKKRWFSAIEDGSTKGLLLMTREEPKDGEAHFHIDAVAGFDKGGSFLIGKVQYLAFCEGVLTVDLDAAEGWLAGRYNLDFGFKPTNPAIDLKTWGAGCQMAWRATPVNRYWKE
jgi:hypothetical protein